MDITEQYSPWRRALKAAFPVTLPIFAGFWFLGLAYGLLMTKSGFSPLWPLFMAMFVFSGSVEFVAVRLLQSPFHPLQSFVIALLICARHLFYGISMLDRFRSMGWKKFFLIFGMCDETFSINYTARIPEGVDHGWFMLWVTVLDWSYWVSGATIGAVAGDFISFNTQGLGFVMTAMFVTIFVEQWMKEGEGRKFTFKEHAGSILGTLISVGCLVVFGAEQFVIPAMVVMLIAFMALRGKLEQE